MTDTSIYCNTREVLQYGCTINFINGARSCGKTYSTLMLMIDDYLSKGRKFVYVRRFDTELNDLTTLFDSVSRETKYDDYTIGVHGKKFYIAKNEKIYDDKIGDININKLWKKKYLFGQAINLSTSANLKSRDFSSYYYMMFEEYIIENQFSHYLKNEINIFLELLSTVFRQRDFRVFFLGNALKTVNPYFTYFHIMNPNKEGITRYKLNGKKQILVWYYKKKEFETMINDTTFGNLVKNSAYGDYAISNVSLYDNEEFIEKKTPNAKFMFSVVYLSKTYGFWLDGVNGKLYCNRQIPKGYNNHYIATRDDQTPNMLMFKTLRNKWDFKLLREAFDSGFLYYDSVVTKSNMTDCLQLFNMK